MHVGVALGTLAVLAVVGHGYDLQLIGLDWTRLQQCLPFARLGFLTTLSGEPPGFYILFTEEGRQFCSDPPSFLAIVRFPSRPDGRRPDAFVNALVQPDQTEVIVSDYTLEEMIRNHEYVPPYSFANLFDLSTVAVHVELYGEFVANAGRQWTPSLVPHVARPMSEPAEDQSTEFPLWLIIVLVLVGLLLVLGGVGVFLYLRERRKRLQNGKAAPTTKMDTAAQASSGVAPSSTALASSMAPTSSFMPSSMAPTSSALPSASASNEPAKPAATENKNTNNVNVNSGNDAKNSVVSNNNPILNGNAEGKGQVKSKAKPKTVSESVITLQKPQPVENSQMTPPDRTVQYRPPEASRTSVISLAPNTQSRTTHTEAEMPKSSNKMTC